MDRKARSDLRIGLLFHKNPLAAPVGIDLVRLRGLSLGLARLGANVAVVAPVAREGGRLGPVPVLPLAVLAEAGRFDVLKTCYHFSLELLGSYDGPLVCRFVRVVDETLPQRDAPFRERLLVAQSIARERAWGVVTNNAFNVRRWRQRYGDRQRVAMIPTGCPASLPPLGPNPFAPDLPPVLFLGSLASRRMASMLSEAAERLREQAVVHFVGRNKTDLYGGRTIPVSPLVAIHGEMEERATWDYVRHARMGLALAAGPDVFDNDLSKVVAYLRGGLPVLGEARLTNSRIFCRHGFGAVFRYGDGHDLAAKAGAILAADYEAHRALVMTDTASRYSWDGLAVALLSFCRMAVGAS